MTAIDPPWQVVLAAGKSLPVRTGNKVSYLIDGNETYGAIAAAIETVLNDRDGSSYYVYILGWWVDLSVKATTSKTQSFKERLTEASQAGAQILLMAWDSLIPGAPNKEAVTFVNGLKHGAAILDNQTLNIATIGVSTVENFPALPHLRTGSQHQKVVVVRGKRGLIGFCGGLDLSPDRVTPVSGHPGSPFHDVHCQIEGQAVTDLVDVFLQRWEAHPEHDNAIPNRERVRGLVDRRTAQKEPVRGDQPVAIARTFNKVLDTRGYQACSTERTVASTLTNVISRARRYIYIEDQYLVHPEAAVLLGTSLKKGLQHITILVPHSGTVDLPRVWDARGAFIQRVRATAGELNAAKIRVFYRTAPGAREIDPVHPPPGSYVHAKVWIVDNELAVIGSANVNRRGWEYDSEVAAFVADSDFAKRLLRALWAKHLGVPASSIVDGQASANLWLDATGPNSASRFRLAAVRRYEDKPIRMPLGPVRSDSGENGHLGDPADASMDLPDVAQSTLAALFEEFLNFNVTRETYERYFDPSASGLKKCASP